MVNHLPNSHLLTNKLGLLNSLKEYERVTLSTKGRLPRLKMSEFHPETYKLDEKGDRDLFLEVYKGIYSRTSMARTLMARLPRLFRTPSRVPRKKSHSCRFEII